MAITTLIGSQQRQETQQETEIHALLDQVSKAHHEKDAESIVAAYAPDAVVFNLAPPLRSLMMAKAADVKAWLDTWDGPVEHEARDFSFEINGNAAFGYGYYRLGGNPKSAGRKVSFWMRATLFLRREADGWRIVHEHTSVPFYMDGSLRPAFDLEP
jgi:ketosteroid isomerase-like protein